MRHLRRHTRHHASQVRLDPHTLMTTFNRTFDDLSARAREADAYLERWMSDMSVDAPPGPDDEPEAADEAPAARAKDVED